MKQYFPLALSILVMLSLTVGCKKSPDDEKTGTGNLTIKQNGGNVDVEITGPQGGKIKVETGKPKVEVKVELPTNFPKDIPILPGAKTKSHNTIGKTTTVTLETPASLSDVVDYYKKTLAIKGWKVNKPVEYKDPINSSSGMNIGANKPKRPINVMMFESNDMTIIKITF